MNTSPHPQPSTGSGFASSAASFQPGNINYEHPSGPTCSPGGYATGHITGQNSSGNTAVAHSTANAVYYWPNGGAGDLGEPHPGFGGMTGADVLNNNYPVSPMEASQGPHHNYPWLSMPGKKQNLIRLFKFT